MCQMRVVLKEDDHEEVIMDGVAALTVTGEGILVNALLEPPQLVEGASLNTIDFLSGTVTLSKRRSA